MMIKHSLILVFFLLSVCRAQDEIDKLVAIIKATRTFLKMPQLPAKGLDGKFDPRIMRALAELFDSTNESEHSELRWLISSQLLNTKDPNPRYFLEIEKEMKWFLSFDVPPLPSVDDTPEQPFRKWCGSLAPPLLPNDCYQNYVMKPMRLIFYAQMTNDSRFIPLFRQGLSTGHEAIWRMCAVHLGMINDRESLPRIAQKIAATKKPAYATMLLAWDDPLADQMALDIAKSDTKALSMVRANIEKRDERKRNLKK